MVIDFHTHILPHMDDGSRSTAMSGEMLRQMQAAGVDAVAATPHYYRQREQIGDFLQRREAAFQHLLETIHEPCPRILCGAEVAFYFGMEEDPELQRLCFAGTDTILVEMPAEPWSDYEVNAIASLCYDRRLSVVLAHYERFERHQRSSGAWARLLKLPVKVQLNAGSLLPLLGRGKWLELLRSGQAHLLGSDCHNMDKRPPNLDKARQLIVHKLGAQVLQRLDAQAEALAVPVPEGITP